MKDVLTFIMAGGIGKRLFPLTRDRAKPAVPFGGIYRLIDFPLSNCINSGLRKIHVLTQYKSMSLERHISMGWSIFHRELDEYIDMIPAQMRVGERWYEGTADAIYQNIYAIQMTKEEHILILSGDHVYKMDYRGLINFHKDNGADLTVSVVKMPREAALQCGVVEIAKDNKIAGFKEKPSGGTKSVLQDKNFIYASMGIYVFKKEVLKRELEKDAKSDTEHDFGRNIVPSMINKKYKTLAFIFGDAKTGQPAYWRDVGTIDSYYDANMDLVSITPVFNLYDDGWPIRTYHEQAPPAKTVFTGTEEGSKKGEAVNSLLSNGCIISGGKVIRSVLSPNVRINSYACVEDSILMEGVDVGRHAKIKRAVVDKDVKIPANAEIGYNPERDRKNFFVSENGIVVVAKKTDIVL